MEDREDVKPTRFGLNKQHPRKEVNSSISHTQMFTSTVTFS